MYQIDTFLYSRGVGHEGQDLCTEIKQILAPYATEQFRLVD